MRKLRFYGGVARLFIKRFSAHIIAGILLGLIVFLLKDYLFTLPIFSKPERIGVLGKVAVERLPLQVAQYMSEGLTTVAEDGTAQPGLAQTWESKEEGKVWTFTLKPNTTWQDGAAIRSRDLHYNFPDVQITYPDDSHIEFHAQDPYSAFPILVSRPLFKKGLLGIQGEWQAKKVTLDGQYVDTLLLENAKSKKLRLFRFYETENALLSAYKLGEIDIILDISDPKDLSFWKNTHIESSVDTDRVVALFFNTDNPLFNDNKSLRQALAYAVNKEKFGQARALGPLSPHSWAANPLVKPYEYDSAHAKEMISRLKNEQKPTELSIVTVPYLLSTAESVAQDWRQLGIKVNVQVAAGVPPDFQVLLAMIEIPPDPDQYSLWHSTQQETNITHFKNPRIDKLLEDGRRTLDQEQRKRIYLDFQRFLVEEAPAIFLYYPKSYTIARE